MKAPRLARLFAWLVAIAALLVGHVARAETPDLDARVDTDVVGLGDVVHVTLQAAASAATPIDPQIGATGGLVVVGISPSTSTSMTITNGRVSTQRVLTTVWTLRAQKVGTSVIGPLSVSVDGTRYHTAKVHVRVVLPSQAPPRAAPPQPQNPFDPFGMLQQLQQFPMPPMPGFDARPQMPPDTANVDPRLALDAPRAPVAFLHAVADKTSAVVGEQVTFTVYLYVDPSAITHDPQETDAHEAPASDFLRQSMELKEDNTTVREASVGGRVWLVATQRRAALFPLKTGDLDIGEMRMTIVAPGAGPRATEDLHVRVTEPPIQGRPPGYSVGDVGAFSMSAEVVGREVEQGGAIGVNVTISGTGNLPSSIAPPEHRGVEWLEPQTDEKVGPQAVNGATRWGGTRTFRYVVRLHEAGVVDLGDFTLPYWDPDAKEYRMARAALGAVRVTPGAAAAAEPEAKPDPLPGLPPVRTALSAESAPRARAHWTDAAPFWLALGAMPLAYAVAVAAQTTAQRAKERRAARAASPQEELRARVAAADAASANGDAHALDAATARAIEAAAIAGRGVNVRGLATSDVARALEAAGVDAGPAREIEEVLRGCEAARFSAGVDGAEGEAKARWDRAKRLVSKLTGGSDRGPLGVKERA